MLMLVQMLGFDKWSAGSSSALSVAPLVRVGWLNQNTDPEINEEPPIHLQGKETYTLEESDHNKASSSNFIP